MTDSLGAPPLAPSAHLELNVTWPTTFLTGAPSNCVPSILLRLPPALFPDVHALQRTAPKATYHILESRVSNAEVDWKFSDVESPVGVTDPKAEARRAYAESGGEVAEPVEAKPRRAAAAVRAGSSSVRSGSGDRAQAYGSVEQAERDYNLPLARERRVLLVQLGKAGAALNTSQTGMPLHIHSRYLPPTASAGPRPGWLDVQWGKVGKIFWDPKQGNYWNVELSPPQLFWSCRGQRSLDEEEFGDVFAPSALLPSPYSHFTLHPPLISGTRLVRPSISEDASASAWPSNYKLRLPTGDADLAAFTQVITIIVTLVGALYVALGLITTIRKVRVAEDTAEKRRLGKMW